jgi:hypothetical protein
MSRYYCGPKPCPGCNTSGEDRPRYNGAGGLCSVCVEYIKLGKAVKAEPKVFSSITPCTHTICDTYKNKNGDREGNLIRRPVYLSEFSTKLSYALRDFLKTLDLGMKEEVEYSIYDSDVNWHDNIYVKTDTALAYFEFIKVLLEYSVALYNDGFNYGKSLLIGLNSGRLSLQDFEESVGRHK